MGSENGVNLELLRDLLTDGFERTEKRIDDLEERVEHRCDLIQSAVQQQGTQIALIQQQCGIRGADNEKRDRRISNLARAIGAQEVSQSILVTRASTTWRTLVLIGSAVVAGAGLAATILQLWR